MHDECSVVSSTGLSSAFDAGRLMRDLALCFGHQPEKAAHAYWIEQTVENKLLTLKKLRFSSQEIVAIAYDALSSFDKLAGDLYAARHNKSLG